MGYPNVKDAQLIQTKALPNGAATTTSDGFNLHSGIDFGSFQAPIEAVLTIPALTSTQLPDTQTVTYTIEHSDVANFGSGVSAISGSVVQTGASSAGAAATELRVRVPSTVKKYIRAKAVKTGAADASTATMTLSVVF